MLSDLNSNRQMQCNNSDPHLTSLSSSPNSLVIPRHPPQTSHLHAHHIPILSPHLPPLPPKKPNPSQHQSPSQQATPKPFSIPSSESVNPVTLDRHSDPLHGPQHELVVVDR